MARKSLLPDAKRNLENWVNLLERADCLRADLGNLRGDVERTMDRAKYSKSRALETVCDDLRLEIKQDQPVLYCANPNRACQYRSRETSEIKTSDGYASVQLCNKEGN